MGTQCLNCGKPFVNARADKMFCDSTCRAKYNRRHDDKEDDQTFIVRKEAEFNFPDVQQSEWQDRQREKFFRAEQETQLFKKAIHDFDGQYQQLIQKGRPIQAEREKCQKRILEIEKMLLKNVEQFFNEYLNREYIREISELRQAQKARDLGQSVDQIIFDMLQPEKHLKQKIQYGSAEFFSVVEAKENLEAEMETLLEKQKQYLREIAAIVGQVEKIEELRKQPLIQLKAKQNEIKNLKEESYIPAITQPNLEAEFPERKQSHISDFKTEEPKAEITPQLKKDEFSGADLMTKTFETFSLNGDIGRFMGKLERKKLAITLTGESGAGKTWFSYFLAKAFIDYGFRVKYFSLEEGVGNLAREKVLKYGLHSDHFKLTETGGLKEVREAASEFDVVLVDSYSKISENRNDFENLRTDFPDTIFLIIFQQTSSGQMRGGPAMKYNSSITIDMFSREGNRIAMMEKNRYGTQGWEYDTGKGMLVWDGAARKKPKN